MPSFWFNAVYAFMVHSFFWKSKLGFSGLFFLEILQLSAEHQGMFFFKKSLAFTKSFICWISAGYYCNVTLGDIEKIINNDFVELEAE